ncbi:MAG: site-2 protease family protein [Flammeovirgaceae bacterium]
MDKKKKPKVFQIAFGMVLGGVIGFAAAHYGIKAGRELPGEAGLLLAIAVIPVFFLVIGVHEAGHAIAGVWQKFDFRMYVIGPFLWDKEQDGWKFKWNKNVNTAGGMVICLPTGTHDLQKRFTIFAAGGPVASLLLTLFGYLLFMVSVPATISYLFLMMGVFSLLIFSVTALPFHAGGFTSDGGRILNLQRGGDASRFELLILKIITESIGGLRPSQLNVAELQEADMLAKKLKAPFGVYLNSYFYQAAWDKGDVAGAEKHLQDYIEAIDAIPDGIKGIVWCEAAFFYAFAKHDLDKAMHYWLQFKPSAMVPRASVLATELAIELLKNGGIADHAKIDVALRELLNMLDRGAATVLKERLLALKSDRSMMAEQTF